MTESELDRFVSDNIKFEGQGIDPSLIGERKKRNLYKVGTRVMVRAVNNVVTINKLLVVYNNKVYEYCGSVFLDGMIRKIYFNNSDIVQTIIKEEDISEGHTMRF